MHRKRRKIAYEIQLSWTVSQKTNQARKLILDRLPRSQITDIQATEKETMRG